MTKHSEKVRELLAKNTREMWANMTPEEREEFVQKQKAGAKRMWARRSEAERRRIGEAISKAKREAAAKRRKESESDG